MEFEEFDGKLTKVVEFYTKEGDYIGFRTGENAWGIAADEGDPDPDPDDVMAAEIVEHYIDEEGNDTFVVDLG